jgi:hypothetical protein
MIFLLSGIQFFWGARETVLRVSSLGWWLIISAGTCSAVFVVVGMARGSRSGSLDSDLVLLRKIHTGAWLLRVVATATLVGLLVALFSWMWTLVGIRNLPARFVEMGGEVVGFSRASPVNRLCRFHIHVRLDDGQLEEICAERGTINRTTPAALLELKEHDKVMVMLRSNALGTAAAITGSTIR